MITNTSSLPGPVYRAIADNPYETREGFSVTELISPPRMAWLRALHDPERDVKDEANTLIGNAVHSYLDANSKDYEDTEIRLSVELDGQTIHGQPDYYHTGLKHLIDYKTTGITSWSKEKEDWEQQANTYAYILRKNGKPVERISILCVFKDWSPMRAQFKGDYPPSSIALKELPIWPDEECEGYIRERLALHLNRNSGTLCTDEDRWITPEYAVMKPGNTRATRVFATHEEAKEFIGESDQYEIEFRAGSPIRCLWYCSASSVCEQWIGEGV